MHVPRRARQVAVVAAVLAMAWHGSRDWRLVASQWSLTLPRPAGQPASPDSQTQPDRTFRTAANFVRVDVYPTRDGVMVPGLTTADFEVFEDGVVQHLDRCEFVQVRASGPQASRREPSTVASARGMAEEARARVFVLFLDTYHVGVGGSARVRSALPSMLRRMLGPDDLVGIMTPQMSAGDVTFTRRIDEIDVMLDRQWTWGGRDQFAYREPEEAAYEGCYPEQTVRRECSVAGHTLTQSGTFYAGIALEMTERRREKKTIDAVEDLTRWLGGVRDERKAVILVSDGWRLFRPNEALTRRGDCEPLPWSDGVGLDGRRGRPTNDPDRRSASGALQACERDRNILAALDNARTFRELLDRANRSNVSFYPIDPRGLPVFDTSVAETRTSPDGMTQPLLTVAEDSRRLTGRIETLRTLAAATDGLAVTNSNDIERGLRRVAADMASYYLLGYYSTNARPDGKFRALAVRVRRPGVDVRARRGYLAATPEEVAAKSAASPGPADAIASARASVLASAITAVAAASSPTSVRARLSWLGAGAGSAGSRVWAVAELDRKVARTGGELAAGAEIVATLATESGAALGEQRVALAAGGRVAVFDFVSTALDSSGLVLRLRVNPSGGGLPITETVRAALGPPGGSVGTPRYLRRGPVAVSPYSATADPRLSRTERLRIDIPVLSDRAEVSGELLDRTGKPIALPVACVLRAATPGEPAWVRCELVLAPLAPGDYAIRTMMAIDGRQQEIVSAFRVQ